MLSPKHGEPQRCERIRIKRDAEGNVLSTEWYELVEEPGYDADGPRQLT
jgi:hypothetical protein